MSSAGITEPVGSPELAGQIGEPPAPNPILMVHRCLRGRYLIAFLLGTMFAAVCAPVGYLAMKPVYESRALLVVNPTLPAILFEDTDITGQLPAFDAFVENQASILRGSRVRGLALDTLQDSGWPGYPAGAIELDNARSVVVPRRSNNVLLTVRHTDPGLAQAAAKAILDAYVKIRDERETREFVDREERLQELRNEYLETRNTRRRRAMQKILDVAGVGDLAYAEQLTLEEIARYQSELDFLQQSSRAQPPPLGGRPVLADVAPDAELFDLERELETLERQERLLLSTHEPAHWSVRRLRRSIESTERAVESRRAELEAMAEAVSDDGDDATARSEDGDADGAVAGSPAARPQTREAAIEELESRISAARTKLNRLADAKLEVLGLEQEADAANELLEDAKRRLEALQVERQQQTLTRVEVFEEPERPLAPASDKRVQLAGVGLVGGFGMGVASVVGFGLLLPRLRATDDLEAAAPDVQVLGLIPQVDQLWAEGSPALESAHVLRAILDAKLGDEHTTICVTSPTAGDGKTTISLLLAAAYAAAGRKCLLVDADLAGANLTSGFGLLDAAGLSDDPDELRGVTVSPEGARFDFVPVGQNRMAAEAFCRRTLRRVIDGGRRHAYDTVIIDTGPLLGSVEALAACPLVDQVLLVASRGLGARPLRYAVERLNDLHAKRIGMVYNRATNGDISRSSSPSMSRRRSIGTSTFAQPLPAGSGSEQ